MRGEPKLILDWTSYVPGLAFDWVRWNDLSSAGLRERRNCFVIFRGCHDGPGSSVVDVGAQESEWSKKKWCSYWGAQFMFGGRGERNKPRPDANAAVGLILPIVVEAEASGESESARKRGECQPVSAR
jgi:hypothetical protein